MIAIATANEVVIEVIEKERTQRVFKITRPKVYPSENLNRIAQFLETMPCLAWGSGRTPNYNM